MSGIAFGCGSCFLVGVLREVTWLDTDTLLPAKVFSNAWPDAVIGFARFDGVASREFDDDGSEKGSALAAEVPVICVLLLLDVNGASDANICVVFSACKSSEISL